MTARTSAGGTRGSGRGWAERSHGEPGMACPQGAGAWCGPVAPVLYDAPPLRPPCWRTNSAVVRPDGTRFAASLRIYAFSGVTAAPLASHDGVRLASPRREGSSAGEIDEADF